jgi:heavy metal translocating P-type ATPase
VTAVDGTARRRRSLLGAPTEVVLLVVATTGLVVGGGIRLLGAEGPARVAWAIAALSGVGPSAAWALAAVRRRQLGADVVALLALTGTLLVGEPLAGALIAVMMGSGRSLEVWATGRARHALTALLDRVPRSAHLHDGRDLRDVPIDEVVPGQVLAVLPGEVLPVDGTVARGTAVIDESSLTGEPLPVERAAGGAVRSGVVNAGSAFDLLATTRAADSTYAAVVGLVAQAAEARTPSVRLADRFAGLFLGLSLLGAAVAWWWSGDPVRAVAVLVVATPCPLILAVPVAVVSGVSTAARRGVIVKGGAALERLGTCHTVLFDKTGTITAGRPSVAETVPVGAADPDEALRLAASLDQVSPHVLASSIVRCARARGLELELPTAVQEVPGRGIRGVVGARTVAVGKAGWVVDGPDGWARPIRRRADVDGAITVFVSVDGQPAAGVLLEDRVRVDASRAVRALRRAGIGRVVMVTGDRADVAEGIGAIIGVDEVRAERVPKDKVDDVLAEQARGPVVMVGDGINDAAALAAAEVGVAIGTSGATATSEAADMVLTVDRLDRLADALHIARRTRRIAQQSAGTGITLSLVAMAFAATGALAPVWGALVQEAIDVAVIVNALRVLRFGWPRARLAPDEEAITERFRAQHRYLGPEVERLRETADHLDEGGAEAVAALTVVDRFLVDELQPHEQAEDAVLYPVMDRVYGAADATGTMSRGHAEIARLSRRFHRLVAQLDPTTGPDEGERRELRRLLYGLHAVLQLHFAQEDESYLSLVGDDGDRPVVRGSSRRRSP